MVGPSPVRRQSPSGIIGATPGTGDFRCPCDYRPHDTRTSFVRTFARAGKSPRPSCGHSSGGATEVADENIAVAVWFFALVFTVHRLHRHARCDSDILSKPDHPHGGSSGIRTHDILLAKQMLYQLSYTPSKRKTSCEANHSLPTARHLRPFPFARFLAPKPCPLLSMMKRKP